MKTVTSAVFLTAEEGNTEHGNDEPVRAEEVQRGPRVLFDVVAKVAAE